MKVCRAADKGEARVPDPRYDFSMDEIPVSKFKVNCVAALECVRRTGQPLRVTRYGRPLVDVVPVSRVLTNVGWVGAMRGRGRIMGDLKNVRLLR